VAILTDHVAAYLERLRPERSPVMAEMESLAERDGIPIVHWETGRFLATLVAALDPAIVLEVGTAIGYSTLHMAEALGRGRIVTVELDAPRVAEARDFLGRAGVLERVELVEGDALEELPGLEGPFDLVFIDAAKTESPDYLERVEDRLAERAVLVVDNLLMSGEVALPEDAETRWREESLRAARELNPWLVNSERWLGAVLPIGDGVGFATRRPAH
jgi:predicted O-methyltransferase YrrM